ncbi:MAG: TMEM165/GDT1 family protein [Chloroflexi bacterium]|nr:TMEM165/GDT1 family protein [Chloroflexota bacterium]
MALTSFGLIFLMELGDKSQLAVLTLAARTGQAKAVFAGATLALTAVTLLGVLVGTVLGELVPWAWVSRLAGLAFLVIGALTLWSSRPGASSPESSDGKGKDFLSSGVASPLRVLSLSFGLLFLAEMGDKTQLAVVGMAAKTGMPVSVFLGAALAEAFTTLLAVLAGKAIVTIVPLRWVTRGAGVLFVVVGVLTLADVF